MDPAIERSRPYEMGVLLVHGIGNQQKGETLLEAGNALVEALRARLAWLTPAGHRALRSTPSVNLTGVALYRDIPEEIARAELEIGGVDGVRRPGDPAAAPGRWLLAESWWAESFPPPPYLSVFAWVVNILPGTLVTHFDRRLRRTLFEISNPDNLTLSIFKYPRLVRDIASLFAAILLVPPLLCALMLALLIGFLPVPFAETIARTLQRIIATIVGDSYALLGNALLAGSLVSRVRRDTQWLADRCERVVVIAHSQGGAIAHMAVRQDPLTECELLITYGSGLHKLTLVEQMTQQPGTALVWVAVLLFLLATSTVAAGLIAGATSSSSLALAAFFAMAAVLVLAAWLRSGRHSFSRDRQQAVDRELFERRFQLRNDRVEWWDVYASDDPVPNGPLLDEFVPPSGLKTHATHNLGSLIRDHTSYWRNRDDFVSRIARALLFRAGIDTDRDTERHLRERIATHRRRWRVSWRRASGWVAGIAVGSVAVRLWNRPPDFMAAAYQMAARAARQAPLIGEWLAPPAAAAFHSPAGVALFAALLVSVGWGLKNRWEAWNRAEIDAFFHRAAFTNLIVPAVIYWALLLMVLLAGTMALFGRVPLFAAAAVGLIAVATLLSDRLAHTRFWERILARSASGPITEVGDRWRSLDERALGRHVQGGRRSAIFEMGRRQTRSEDPAERDLGKRALERAVELGVAGAGWWLGQHLETEGDWHGAQRAYESGRALGDSFAAYSLGRLLTEHLKNDAAAMAVLQDAAFRMNERLAAHSLGLMLKSAGQRTATRRAYQRGVILNDALSVEWLGDEYLEAARDRTGRMARRSAEVLRAAAERCYRRAVECGSRQAALALGRLLHERRDLAGAIDAFRAGIRLRDDDCAHALGELFLREGRGEEAEGAFRQAIEFSRPTVAVYEQSAGQLTPAAARSAWQLGQRLEARGSFDPAERLYRFAAGPPGASFGLSEPAVRLGQRLHERGDVAEAAAIWRRAIELSSIEARVLLAEALRNTGKHEESLTLLREADGALAKDFLLVDEDRTRLCLAVGDAFRAHYADDEATASYWRATDRGYRRDGAAGADVSAPFVELVTRRGNLDGARRLAGESWRIRSVAVRLDLARFLIAQSEPGIALPLLADFATATAEETVACARLLEAAGDERTAINAYEQALHMGSAAGAARLIALLQTAGDPYRLKRAVTDARLLGAVVNGVPSVT